MREVPKEEVLRSLAESNPWWQPPHTVGAENARLKPREYLTLFYPLVARSKVRRGVLLLGPRRVGKTVMLYHTIQSLLNDGVEPRCIAYLSVDQPIYHGRGLEQLLDLVSEASGHQYAKHPSYLFFDEIQYLPGWENHLKTLVDSHPETKFVASGSAAAALRMKSAESGAGRFTDFLLPPLTFYEYLEMRGDGGLLTWKSDASPEGEPDVTNLTILNERFVHYLNFGGYPEVVLSEEIQRDPARFIKSDIIDRVLLRDLPSLYGIRDIQELNALFTALAYNTAGEVSLEDLSSHSDVAKNTIKKYIEYLEAAFLIKVVHRVDRDGRRFNRATAFKVYLTNPSMRAALFSPVSASDDDIGHLAETGIFAQWFHSSFEPHYARWANGEVDIVGNSWAVEVKWSDRYFDNPNLLKSLLTFADHTKRITDLSVTTLTRTGVKQIGARKISFLPASVYCAILGRNIIRGRKYDFPPQTGEPVGG